MQDNDLNLTELAAPKPAPEIEVGDDLEQEEQKNRGAQQLYNRPPGVEDDNNLAELAVPEPLQRSGEADKSVLDVETSYRSRAYNEFIVVSWLTFFSMLGTLARLGVEALAVYPNAPFSSAVGWANFGGCLFLGFLIEDRALFHYVANSHKQLGDHNDKNDHIDRVKKTLPLYVGLATGFCGSLTSFSTVITDAVLVATNRLAPPSSSPYHSVSSTSINPRNGGYDCLATLAILIIQTTLSICGFKTGSHFAIGLERIVPSLPVRLIRRFLDPMAPVLGFGGWFAAVLLTIFPPTPTWRFRALMPLVFAPPGAVLRFMLARNFNARIPSFPLGTFIANIVGTCIEGMCYNLQHSRTIVRGAPSRSDANICAILEGVMQGFCGSTTTVSTWVAELNGLRRRHDWIMEQQVFSFALASKLQSWEV